MAQEERSAVLVVRLWRESGAEGAVRGRITMTANADEAGATETAVAGAEEILDVVRGWLDEFEST
jgi:hypothetical protein